MGYQGTNVFLGGTLVGQTYLGDNRIEYSPFFVAPIGIVTTNLILNMDSTDSASYPGSGTDWFNLVVGVPITASFVNTITYSGGYLGTNGIDSYINIPVGSGGTSLDFRSSKSTVMVATRYTTTSGNGRMCSTGNVSTSNWLLGHYQNTVDNYYPNGTIYGTPGSITDTNWRIYTGTTDNTGNECDFYINDTLLVNDGASNTVGTYAFQIGRNSNGTE
jgi:hypothetical protein